MLRFCCTVRLAMAPTIGAPNSRAGIHQCGEQASRGDAQRAHQGPLAYRLESCEEVMIVVEAVVCPRLRHQFEAACAWAQLSLPSLEDMGARLWPVVCRKSGHSEMPPIMRARGWHVHDDLVPREAILSPKPLFGSVGLAPGPEPPPLFATTASRGTSCCPPPSLEVARPRDFPRHDFGRRRHSGTMRRRERERASLEDASSAHCGPWRRRCTPYGIRCGPLDIVELDARCLGDVAFAIICHGRVSGGLATLVHTSLVLDAHCELVGIVPVRGCILRVTSPAVALEIRNIHFFGEDGAAVLAVVQIRALRSRFRLDSSVFTVIPGDTNFVASAGCGSTSPPGWSALRARSTIICLVSDLRLPSDPAPVTVRLSGRPCRGGPTPSVPGWVRRSSAPASTCSASCLDFLGRWFSNLVGISDVVADTFLHHIAPTELQVRPQS